VSLDRKLRSFAFLLIHFTHILPTECMDRGADKSLARPGKKQATATEDFEIHISYLLT
jgi:hypothetical protein